MMKVEGQQVERRRRENRGAVGAEDRDAEGAEGVGFGKGVSPSPMGAVGGGRAPSPEFFIYFLSRYAAFWVQSDAFSDITRPVPNSLHSQHAESSDIIKPASATLGKGCRAF